MSCAQLPPLLCVHVCLKVVTTRTTKNDSPVQHEERKNVDYQLENEIKQAGSFSFLLLGSSYDKNWRNQPAVSVEPSAICITCLRCQFLLLFHLSALSLLDFCMHSVELFWNVESFQTVSNLSNFADGIPRASKRSC